jgi:hypothetical protein
MRVASPLAHTPWFRLPADRRSAALCRQQAQLVERTASQRAELGEIQTGLKASTAWLQTGFTLVGSIRSHPQVALLSLVAASMPFGKRFTKARNWMLHGLAVHQLYKLLGSIGLLQAVRRGRAGRPHAPGP